MQQDTICYAKQLEFALLDPMIGRVLQSIQTGVYTTFLQGDEIG